MFRKIIYIILFALILWWLVYMVNNMYSSETMTNEISIKNAIKNYELDILNKLNNSDSNDRQLILEKIKEDLTNKILNDDTVITNSFDNIKVKNIVKQELKKLTFGDETSHISVDNSGSAMRIEGNILNVDTKQICINDVCLDVKNIATITKKIMSDTGIKEPNEIINIVNDNIKYSNSIGTILSKRDGRPYSSDTNDYIIYDDIFEAYSNGIVTKYKNPKTFNITQYADATFGGKNMIQFGGNVETLETGGATIVIPSKFSVLWLHIPTSRITAFNVYYEKNLELIGTFTCGHSNYNTMAPDGGPENSFYQDHMWLPIAIQNGGNIIITSSSPTDNGLWLSGIAFSTNPFNHASITSISFGFGLNNSKKIQWVGRTNYGTAISMIPNNVITNLYVPIVFSGFDKLLYFVFCDQTNGTYDRCAITSVSANDVKIERFRSTYNNPFNQHHKRRYTKYFAAKIPKELIKQNAKFIKISFDLTKQNIGLPISEIGTHDFI